VSFKRILAIEGYCAATPVPKALYVPSQRKTFFAWHTINKKILVGMYNHATETFANLVEVDDLDFLGALDAHYAPAINILPNGKLLCMYGCHNTSPYYKISDSAYDITSWGSRLTISRTHTYPQLIAYPTVDNPTKLILFIRHYISSTQNTWERYETINGTSWGSPLEIVNFGGGISPYMLFYQRDDKLFLSGFKYTHATSQYEDYYFGYSLGEGDGTSGDEWRDDAGGIKALPLDATEIFAVTSSHRIAEPYALIDENNKLIMLGMWWDAKPPTTGKFRIARYSANLGQAGSWTLEYIEDNGGTDYLTKGHCNNLFIDQTLGRPAFWSYDGESVFDSGYTGKFVRQVGGTKKFDKVYEDNGRLRGGRFKVLLVEQNENYEQPIEVFFPEEGHPASE